MPNKLNAFAKYMFELKGSHSELSMAELQHLAGENWQKMDATERAKYKNGSKNDKENHFNIRVRYNCLGQSIDEVNRQENEKRLKEQKEVDYIEGIIRKAFDNDKLLEEEFYFFSASYYVKMSNDDIFPAEIALGKFSLREGITDVFHNFINPGILPVGMAATALKHSKDTHRLTLPPNTIGETNYCKVLNDILKFLNAKDFNSAYVPPFYVFNDFDGDEYEAAQMTLMKIAELNNCNNAFRVFRAEQLLFSLNKFIVPENSKDSIRSLIQARDQLRRDINRYTTVGCELHYNEDNSPACALSRIKRWGYSIVEFCGIHCIEKIPGQHYPASSNIVLEDFDDDDENDQLESCLTESFHQLRVESTISNADTSSLLSEQPTLPRLSSTTHLSKPVKSLSSFRSGLTNSIDSFKIDSQTDMTPRSSLCNFDSVTTNIDGTSCNKQSWAKNLLKSHCDKN